MGRAPLAACVAVLLLAAPARAEDDLGLGALLQFEASFSRSTGLGATLHLEGHRALTSLRASFIYAGYFPTSQERDDGTLQLVAAGTLLSPVLGVRQILHQGKVFQPWAAAGLGYGWFLFDDDDIAAGREGIDTGRAAWYLEAGTDFILGGRGGSGGGLTFSLRALSSPVGILTMVSLAALWNEE